MKMSRWSNERLLALPDCEDALVIEILRILAEMHSLSYIGRPNLLPLIVRKQLDLTLAHGHTPSLAGGARQLRAVLVFTGDRGGAQRFGEVGDAARRTSGVQGSATAHGVPLPTTSSITGATRSAKAWASCATPSRRRSTKVTRSTRDGSPQPCSASRSGPAARWRKSTFSRGPLSPRSAHSPTPQRSAGDSAVLPQYDGSQRRRLSSSPVRADYDEREMLPAARAEGDEVALSVAATLKLGLHFWSRRLRRAALTASRTRPSSTSPAWPAPRSCKSST